jgi:anti-sigma factor RsiW
MWRAFWKSGRSRCSRTRDALSGYLDRRLNSDEAARVEEHLSTCQGCREELESLRATVVVLHRLPEETPSRSFAVVPDRPLPGRRALPAMRFATATAVLLLVLAFAADWTGLFEGGIISSPRAGPATFDADTYGAFEESESYWVVSGEKNAVDTRTKTPVELLVPDDTDNVQVAVQSLALANDGVLYGDFVNSSEVPQIALMEGKEGSVRAGEVEEFTVVTASDSDQSPFATNGTEAQSALDSIIEEQSGTYLNMVPTASDNNVLYSFNLFGARKEVIAARETDWLRPLEYSLIGLVALLGAATVALWLTQRRVTEASDNRK